MTGHWHIISTLLAKEFKLEFRQKNTLFSSLLFMITTSFVCYHLGQKSLNMTLWSTLFWVIHIFAGFNVTQAHFSSENQGRLLYQYTLISPGHYATYKMIYFSVLLFLLGFVSLLMWLFLGIELQQIYIWLILILINALVLSALLTITSFMSAKLSGNFALISILSLPVLMPHLLFLSKITRSLWQNSPWVMYQKYMLGSGLLVIISMALAFILFPYLWKE